MPNRTRLNDEWDGEPDPDQEPDYLEVEQDEDDDLCGPCPHCGREILEESERCPYCEHYLSREDAPPARKPIWILLGVVACLYVVYRWIVWP
jgi:hypothetical protein